MTCCNTCVIACAGSGKTYDLLNEAKAHAKICKKRILITTFTNENADKIKRDFCDSCNNGSEKVDIQTWERVLIYDFLRPYHNFVTSNKINNIDYTTNPPLKASQSMIDYYYFSSPSKGLLYGKRASKLAAEINFRSNGSTINRLKDIYDEIYIDEVQDFSGDDLTLLDLMLKSGIRIYMVGDVRQSIFFTIQTQTKRKYRGIGMLNQFFAWEKSGLINIQTKNTSRRCNQQICDLGDIIFPELEEKTLSTSTEKDIWEGLFVVRTAHFEQYINKCHPIILRWTKNAKIPFCSTNYEAFNIGTSKGQTYKHVLIIPTNEFKNFICNGKIPEKPLTRSKLYVAITRAKFSVAFLYDGNDYIEQFREFRP